MMRVWTNLLLSTVTFTAGETTAKRFWVTLSAQGKNDKPDSRSGFLDLNMIAIIILGLPPLETRGFRS
jgi:hypothetical protein